MTTYNQNDIDAYVAYIRARGMRPEDMAVVESLMRGFAAFTRVKAAGTPLKPPRLRVVASQGKQV